MVLCLVLVLGLTIGGTIAFLTDKTETLTNTFTVGDISITLTETTTDYKIVPGGESAKDPVITVKSGSEKCYVYALVENNLVVEGTVVGTPNIDTTKWTAVGTNGTKTLYRYNEVVDAASADQELAVFTKVSYANTLTAEQVATLANKTILVSGYAHQKDNTDQATADTAAKTWAGIA